MNDGFTYYAFISYSHRDEQWARWLQRKLENYHLPTAIAKESGRKLPKRISPVFLDASDLAVGKLDDHLHRALEESRYLIVICSPNSAKPNGNGKHFVNDEVGHFCSLGREDFVIPVIVDGVPGDPERECYCPRIKELNLIGPDATKHSRNRVLNDVVAKILCLRPDELWQRERRHRTRLRIFRAVIGTLFAMSMLAMSVIAYDWHRDYVEYYAECGDNWGMPSGILPLTEKQKNSRSSHYRFIYRGRRRLFGERVLREVIHANSADRPTDCDERFEDEDTPVWRKLEYSSDLDLKAVDICKKNGTLLERRELSGRGKTVVDLRFKDKNEAMVGAFLRSSSGPKAAIRRWRIVRDEIGRPRRVFFYRDDTAESPSCNTEGCFGLELEYDRIGRVTRRYYLDCDGEKMTLKNGVAARAYEYGPAGLTLTGRIDSDGKMLNKTTFDYDGRGNVECFSINGFVRVRLKYDDRGNRIEYLYFDSCGMPNEIAKMTCKYDDRGNCIEKAYFGVDGAPETPDSSHAKTTYKYDDRGNCIEEAYFGVEGKPCPLAKKTSKYDDRGNCIEEAYFGVDGKPYGNQKGYARETKKYDDRGNCIEEAFFGVDGEQRREGRAKETIEIKHDERGNCTEIAHFGADGKQEGKMTQKYDERGNCIEIAHFGADGKPCPDSDGVAKWTMKYDRSGNRIEDAYYGVDGNPCLNQYFKIAKCTMKYDRRGNCIEEVYFGADGKPCPDSDGVAKRTMKYDRSGNRIEDAYYGVDGKPRRDGYARETKKFDERGNCIEIAYFDFGGKPCLYDDQRFAKRTQKYDVQGMCIEIAYFGIDGKPCPGEDGVARWTAKYDSRKKCIEKAYFDVDGKLLLYKDGCAKWTAKYDAGKRCVEKAYFGDDGKPCRNEDNVAKWTAKYDSHGNCIEIAYFGIDGKPCSREDGVARWTAKYDSRRNCIEKAYFGVDGKPCSGEEGIARWTVKYDDAGCRQVSCFDVNGRVIDR